ncbi:MULTISPECIES: hypothetical protein [unclassified Caballeronia]|uniref:hypothetical protein n=1 Tax=unclassified Caballeronia TaxID=2646786 RepID=UPI00202857DB|nr:MULTISPECIES: hypothetical protein [unclassified Caballeronia]
MTDNEILDEFERRAISIPLRVDGCPNLNGVRIIEGVRALEIRVLAERKEPVAQIIRRTTYSGLDVWDIKIFDKDMQHGTKLFTHPAPDDASQWQQIETAPKDREVWTFNGEQARMKWSEGPDWALWIWADELLSDADPEPDQPTHWMPLPSDPLDADIDRARQSGEEGKS